MTDRSIFAAGWPLALVGLAVAIVALAVAPARAQQQEVAPAGPTLSGIRERGHLICASVDPLPGFAQTNANGRWTGFDVDICRAIAVSVFGDASRMEFMPLTGDSRFALLQTGAIDVIVRNSPWTMRRDTSYGAIFVGTSFFDGQAIMVPQSLGFVSAYELENIKICLVDEPEQVANIKELFFTTQASYEEVMYEDREDLTVAYRAGVCDAVSASASWLNAMRRSLPEPATHRILPERISKGVFGPVVRTGDNQWLDIVRWTLFSLIDAEEAGVTSLNIDSLAAAKNHRIRRLLGLEGEFGPGIGLSAKFIPDVIKSVGNYGEIFERNFGAGTGAAVVRGQNALWLNGGLLFAPPIE